MVDPTISTQAVLVAGVVTSHVHKLGTYGRARVTDMFQKRIGICYRSV